MCNIPKREKFIPTDHNIYHIALEYTNISYSKALQNLPKWGFWVLKFIPSGNPGLKHRSPVFDMERKQNLIYGMDK
jgi:hypothetical protein